MAQSIIGALRVNLGIDSAQFAEGLEGARGSLAKAGRQMVKIGGLMSAGVAAAMAGVTVAMRGTLNEMDALAKTSRKIGLPIEELSALRHAAELSGVATNTLDMAMQRFTRRAAEAAVGTGEAKDALAEMGIALKDQNGNLRPTRALLDDVADAFAGMEDPARRLRLAFKLFDSEGTAMINMLTGGAAGLREMTDEAAALGLVIDGETAAAAEAFNDNMTRLGATMRGIRNILAAELAPVLESFSDWFREYGPQIVERTRGMFAAFRSLSPEMQRLAAVLGGLAVAAGPVLVVLGTISILLAAISGPVLLVVAGIAALGTAFVYFREDVAAAWETLRGWYSDTVEWLSGLVDHVRDMAMQWGATLLHLSEQVPEYFATLGAEMYRIGGDLISGLISGMQEAISNKLKSYIMQEAGPGVEQYWKDAFDIQSPSKVFHELGEQTMAGLQQGMATGTVGVAAAARQTVDEILAEMQRLDQSIGTSAEIVQQEVGLQMSGVMDPFKAALRDGELSWQTFVEAIVSAGQSMADRLIDLAFKPIEDALDNMLSGGRKGGGGGLLSNLVGSIGGALFGSIGGGGPTLTGPGQSISALGFGSFASGGYGRGMALVGEQGPELVNLGAGARVFNADETAGMMGRGGVVQNNYFEGVNHATRAMLEGMLAQSEAKILRAVPGVASQGFARRPTLRGGG